MYNLSKQFDQFMKKTDPYWNGKENYRVQEEYKKMLKLDPVTQTRWAFPTLANDAHIIAVDL